ncbi:probable cytochrome P450 6a14 [Periplaneta americana]|uniref:probable cytochrome P450 6a14 n=1 Tax=Periplaneta americana TaxID=6978 RepID=UPI0037E98454
MDIARYSTLEKVDPWMLKLAAISTLVLGAIYIYFRVSYSYWKKRGIPTLKTKAPFGDYGNGLFLKKGLQQQITELYKRFEGHSVGGLYRFNKPSLMIRDPDIIKDILVKDFDHFYSRGFTVNEKMEPLQGHLFALSGTKWRNLRVKMTPTFTSGKMKMMFGTLVECGKELETVLQEPAKNGEVIEIKDLLARYTTDIIASCAFGVQCNCMRNPDAEFRTWGRKILQPSFKLFALRVLEFWIPFVSKIFRTTFIPKDVSNYFRKMVKETVEYRENNNVQRNDFMQLMIQMKNKTLGASEGEKHSDEKADLDNLKSNTPFEVTMDVIAAQAFVFFVAGYETSSTTMTFCLYELALNPDIQNRVREEIDAVLGKHGGNITYESILEMEYLDKVVSETLRKYPPVIVITRKCTKPAKLRGTDATVEKGTPVFLPVMAIHHDPKYYPNPEKFDPERFSEEEKSKRPHFSYLPFGEGPRLCIGMRFGLMQTKVGLVNLLSKYEVSVSEKTSVPLVLDQKSFILSPKGGMWLKIVNRA